MDRFATLFRRTAADPRPDGELLAAFLGDRDDDAFAELVRRHGPTVWGVCRRTLSDLADAEDAFQATFLVLVRRASRLVATPTVGPWLFEVAVRTAADARRKNSRRLARFAGQPDAVADPRPAPVPAADLDTILHGLPERYRAVLLMCYVEGLTHREAAGRLGCAEGTVSSLVSRGLAKLRTKFAGREPAVVLAVAGVAVPAGVAAATIRSASSLRLTASLSAAAPPAVTALTREVLRMFWMKKATAAGLAAVLLVAVGFGVGVSVRQGPQAGAASDPTADTAAQPPARNTAPAPRDLAAELADLKKKLVEALKALENAQIRADLARQKLEISEPLGDPITIARCREDIAQAQQTVAVAEANCQVLRDRIAALEAKFKAAPGAPRARAAADDLDKQIAEAKDRLDLVRAQSAALQRRSEDLNAQAAQLQDRIKLLEAQRERDKAAGDPRAAPGGGAVEVRVSGGKAMWPCAVVEYKGGRAVGTLACNDIEYLRVALTRIAKDPTGPKELRIVVDPDATFDRVKVVLEACKSAGFRDAKVSGLSGVPADPLTGNR